MHQHCNFLDLEFSSDRSWLTIMLCIPGYHSPLQIYVLRKDSSSGHGFFTVCLLHHLKCLLVDLPIFGRSLHFPVAETEAFSISTALRKLPYTTVTFFLNTLDARNSFLLE
jgi:hypothetical protein